MRIHNGFEQLSIQGVNVEVLFTDKDKQTVLASSDPNHPTALFFIRTDYMSGISGGVDGNGLIQPETTADLHWLIIPAPRAAEQVVSGTPIVGV